MSPFRFIKTLLALCSFLCIGFTSIPAFSDDRLDEGILETIFLQASDSIENIEGEHLYLNPKKVCLHEQKIYLEGDDFETILLPQICADDQGLFLKIGKNQGPTVMYICRNCTKTYYNKRPSKCDRCKESNFDVRYLWPKSYRSLLEQSLISTTNKDTESLHKARIPQ